MPRTPQKLSRSEVQFETAKLLTELRTPEAQKEFDWVPELTGLLEELHALALQDTPEQVRATELSSRIRLLVRHSHMKGFGNLQAWIDSLIEDVARHKVRR